MNKNEFKLKPLLNKAAPIAKRGKARSRASHGPIILTGITGGSEDLADKLEAGVDYSTPTIDAGGNVVVMCQKWLRDKSDATPTKLPDGPAVALVLQDSDVANLQAAIAAWVNPLITAQFGVAPAAVAPAPAPAVANPSIQLGAPASDGNGGYNYPLSISNGSGTNSVTLQYSTDGGKTWNNFGSAINVPDGSIPLDSPNPTGVSGSTIIQAVLNVGGVNWSSNEQTVTF